jgi:N-acetyl-anhydromuramyl-L-alanine amidase AmpD
MSKGPGGQYILPPLKQQHSPNQSSRLGQPIFGIVMHDTEGSYAGSVDWLCNPRANASAHIVVREDGNEVTQLVPFSRKAWHAMAANWHFIGIELAGFLDREGEEEWRSAARIVAYLCTHFKIPPTWNVRHGGAFTPGITRHADLGAAGGGHHDPTSKISGDESWLWFISLVQREYKRGEFRPQWGVD